ncbi:hypothetical protein [Ammoniphilus resinae]|uniref:Uncharacterized protein n=1 Tax=Ammoniphilus resinae TaxID=861532 RepID=A0ABS4GNC8_9BACL|nr:hypothetical protein [Ammoniphilus resinae]MBP1931768.1 hypothetical protein [Ammoniphilus resinae]
MGIHAVDFMPYHEKMMCIMENEILSLDREERTLLERLAQVREEKYVKQQTLQDMKIFFTK